mmetsp:Transcript_13534/g.20327  ORF Transcript_13534/g.20327 Transcript_13534/m.20327 type:complete len:551 (+) Transcript_13534:52-1704(+)
MITRIYFLSLLLCLGLQFVHASVLSIDIFYPEHLIRSESGAEGNIFVLGYSSLPYSYELSLTSNGQYYPDFGNYSMYVSNSSNRIESNHWRYDLDLGEYEGQLYVQISQNSQFNTIESCPPVSYLAGSTCVPRQGPYTTYIPNVDSRVNMSIYPAFDLLATGTVHTAIHNFYSSYFKNYRNISLFVPSTYVENNIHRQMNVLVLLDGSDFVTEFMVSQAGLESLILSGDIPETVVIGVPPGTNSERCATEECSQRYYEFTPSECNSDVATDCSDKQLTGGGDKLLDMIWDEIIPTVLSGIGMDIGEVSISGSSLGGLMACYATVTRSGKYKRSLGISPSLWWNGGELADVISQKSFASLRVPDTKSFRRRWNGQVDYSDPFPNSVVVSLGTQEGPMYINNMYTPLIYSEYVDQFVNVWDKVGLSDDDTTSTLLYISSRGGVHSLSSWADVFSYGLPRMFETSYPAAYRSQRSVNMEILYPQSSISADCNHCRKSKWYDMDLWVFVIVVLSLCANTILMTAIVYYFCVSRVSNVQEPQYKSLVDPSRQSIF